MYIRKLQVESFKCFDRAELSFRYPDRRRSKGTPPAANLNVLLGPNGTGKSSVLRAIAMAGIAPILERTPGNLPPDLIRHGAERCELRAEVEWHAEDVVRGTRPKAKASTLQFRLEGKQARRTAEASDLDDGGAMPLMAGYGALRRAAPNSTARGPLRYQRVASLLDQGASLVPLPSWLPALKRNDRKAYASVTRLLNDVLPADITFSGKLAGKGGDADYLFTVRGMAAPFRSLSDGYRVFIAWVTDLLFHLNESSRVSGNVRDVRGVVLLDEVDLNMHPEWQRTLLPQLSGALPKLQFILTTHSPLVAASVGSESVFVMEPGDDGSTQVRQYEETIYGRDAQQVLLSPYFGLRTTRAPGAVDEMRELVRKLKPGRPDIALEVMRRLTGETPAKSAKKRPRR